MQPTDQAQLIWMCMAYILFIAPICAILAWNHIVLVIRRRWLDRFWVGYVLFWVIVIAVTYFFKHPSMRARLYEAYIWNYILWMLVLIAIYLQRILIPHLSERNLDRLALVNALALIGFAAMVLGTDGKNSEGFGIYGRDLITYISASSAFILFVFLPFLAAAFPLTRNRKRKHGPFHDPALFILLLGIVGGIILGDFIHNHLMPMTCVFVFSPVVFGAFRRQLLLDRQHTTD